MNSQEIKESGPLPSVTRLGSGVCIELDHMKYQGQMLQEIAFQLAIMNERGRKVAETKQNGRQSAGHTAQRTVVRKSSTTMYFRPASWNVETALEGLINQFYPDPGQPELETLKVGEKSIGTLGTKEGVEVPRIR
jgi:hypothetical protein